MPTDWTSLSFIIPPHSESFGLGPRLRPQTYLQRLTGHLDAAERAGLTGAFVYDFPVAMDPWLAAFDVLVHSARLQPVVAVRPHQESAGAVARRAADLAHRFGRPTHVNVVAGATRSSRAPGDLGDRVAARRRLASFAGEVREELARRLGPDSGRPLVFTPSSSTPGVVPADCVLLMARPRDRLVRDIARIRAEQGTDRIAMLVGLVVRETEEQAWEAAAELHPPDRRQEIAGRMFTAQVVSSEHTAGYALARERDVHDERLWYGAPARGIDAPKLVGSAGQVAGWLRSCAGAGVTDLIVDLPSAPDEFSRIGPVLGG
ncbi:LLM class flavin-dependent oxidoreductase [Streptomyces sp. F63]|uniref:LLM class flavin-dependent oxidoreductase n=1 Tax=Streptomyces sp. F63 TaxID=2824887 RepID=UPI001B386DED|nr:LLM class flavin-dependent oxidoreductase [Streptomyces sp. F63]MBQ0984724.1 LLM class flavin-dependent oxidoreductase [Streptomyces sp. F63]